MPSKLTIDVFRFSELPTDAKGRAKTDHQSQGSDPNLDDAEVSLRALAERFGYSVDMKHCDFQTGSADAVFVPKSNYVMSHDEILKAIQGLGAYDQSTFRGTGECKLTGNGFDEDALDGFRVAFFNGEADVEMLLKAALATWLRAGTDEYAGFYNDDEFSEHCDANNMWFYGDGQQVPRRLSRGLEPEQAAISAGTDRS